VRKRVTQLVAAASLLLLAMCWTLGIAVALHVADGHHEVPHGHTESRGLALAFHGHSHDESTPAHEHPVLRNRAVSAATRIAAPALTSFGIEAVVGLSAASRRFVALADPAHPPPRRPLAPLQLRI
jgi:hypothetical protein